MRHRLKERENGRDSVIKNTKGRHYTQAPGKTD